MLRSQVRILLPIEIAQMAEHSTKAGSIPARHSRMAKVVDALD